MDNLNNLYVPVRERIFALLKSHSIQQKDFANAIGVSTATITDWKKGRTSSFMKKIHPIAKALGTSEVWLLTGKYTTLAPGVVGELEAIADSENIHIVDLIGVGEKLDQYTIPMGNMTGENGKGPTPEERGKVEGTIMLGHRNAADKLPPESKEKYLAMFDSLALLRNLDRYCQLKGVSIKTACIESGAGEGFLDENNPAVQKLQMLASYLGVTTSELLGEEKPTPAAGDGLSEDQKYLIDAVLAMPPDNVRKLRVIVEEVIFPRGK